MRQLNYVFFSFGRGGHAAYEAFPAKWNEQVREKWAASFLPYLSSPDVESEAGWGHQKEKSVLHDCTAQVHHHARSLIRSEDLVLMAKTQD